MQVAASKRHCIASMNHRSAKIGLKDSDANINSYTQFQPTSPLQATVIADLYENDAVNGELIKMVPLEF